MASADRDERGYMTGAKAIILKALRASRKPWLTPVPQVPMGARQRGAMAYRHRDLLADNPYEEGSAEYDEWRWGYTELAEYEEWRLMVVD